MAVVCQVHHALVLQDGLGKRSHLPTTIVNKAPDPTAPHLPAKFALNGRWRLWRPHETVLTPRLCPSHDRPPRLTNLRELTKHPA